MVVGGMHDCGGGVCMVVGGVHGCRGACMVAGGHAWLPGGHAWWGEGTHGCRGHVWLGGMCGCGGEHALLWGCVHGCGGHVWWWGACMAYDEIWLMSGWYTFYWNAFLLFTLLKLSMANHAEHFQQEISELCDQFLELMSTSSAKMDIESVHCDVYCDLTITLWKCSSCTQPLFTTDFLVREECDLKHLACFLDRIQRVWKFYFLTDDTSDYLRKE